MSAFFFAHVAMRQGWFLRSQAFVGELAGDVLTDKAEHHTDFMANRRRRVKLVLRGHFELCISRYLQTPLTLQYILETYHPMKSMNRCYVRYLAFMGLLWKFDYRKIKVMVS